MDQILDSILSVECRSMLSQVIVCREIHFIIADAHTGMFKDGVPCHTQ